MKWEENISLQPYNTFGIDVHARYYAQFHTLEELQELLESGTAGSSISPSQTLILGGGSNILFTQNFDGLVLKNEIRGIKVIREDQHHIYVHVGGGEIWHGFVQYCINKNWAGVENLSLIPGSVGASPIQNIGAYGAELRDVFFSLEALHIKENKLVNLTLNDCEFGYRDSIFKKKYKDQFVITGVIFRLNKEPAFKIAYGDISQQLEKVGVKQLTLKAVSDAIIHIRRSKLPDPQELGNAGSFFKNPQVSESVYRKLKVAHPNLVGHPHLNETVKLAAGWMIEHCGPTDVTSWKGYRKGNAGCYDRQSLVLVNYGDAKGAEIYSLSELIIHSVKEKFDVVLEREVNII